MVDNEVIETAAELVPELADLTDPEYTQDLLNILAELEAVNENLGVCASLLVYILVVLLCFGLYKLFKSLFIS